MLAVHASCHTGAPIAATSVLHEGLWQSWQCFTGASVAVTAVLHGGLWQCFTPHWGLYSSHNCTLWRPPDSAGYASHLTEASAAVTAVLYGGLWQTWPYSHHTEASIAVTAMLHGGLWHLLSCTSQYRQTPKSLTSSHSTSLSGTERQVTYHYNISSKEQQSGRGTISVTNLGRSEPDTYSYTQHLQNYLVSQYQYFQWMKFHLACPVVMQKLSGDSRAGWGWGSSCLSLW